MNTQAELQYVLTVTKNIIDIISFILILITLYNKIIIVPRLKRELKKLDLSADKKCNIENKINHVNKMCMVYIVISILLLFLSGLKEIIVNVSTPIYNIY